MRTVKTVDIDLEVLFHVPFEQTGDESTLCGQLFDSNETEGIVSWEDNIENNEITCRQCRRILRQYKGLGEYISSLK